MTKFFVRLGVIIFWVAAIAAVLYFPKWKLTEFKKNQINIFAWGDILEPSVIADFEKETGIKVRLSYYSSNEELLVKLKATKGEGYDLIIPSDYAVNLLRSEGLLKEIDQKELSFWPKINPLLLGHYFDPENKYSVPFEWEIFLIGINKDYFAGKDFVPSWKLIFDKNLVHYRIAMINDPREAIQLSSFYLYGILEKLSDEQLHGVQNLLIQQKSWVEAYASFRADYFLATRNCPVVVASSSYILRAMKKYPFVGYVIPEEGTFITIENLAIPAASGKEKLVYQLINYLFRPSSIVRHYEAYSFFPSTFTHGENPLITITPEQFDRFHFISRIATQQQVDKIWIDVKSSSEKL